MAGMDGGISSKNWYLPHTIFSHFANKRMTCEYTEK